MNQPLKKGIVVAVLSHNDYLKMQLYETVKGVPDTLALETQGLLEFEIATLSGGQQIIGRASDDWVLTVSDTREDPLPWRLEVALLRPFVAGKGDTEHISEDILVFVDKNGGINKLGVSPVLIYMEDMPLPNTTTAISWDNEQGLLVYLDGQQVCTRIPYTTALNWYLSDTP